MKVSVIIPTYNREKFVGKAVESVLAQTYKNFEVIVVDDGSTDHTKDVLIPFGNRLRLITQVNGERANARNNGIRQAQGEIIAFLDSDDFWPSDHLEKSLRALEEDPKADLVWSDVTYVDAEGNFLWQAAQHKGRGKMFQALICNNFINQSSVVMRKKVFEEVGYFNEDRLLSGAEDWEMWLRVADRFLCRHLSGHHTFYRLHDSFTMTNPQSAERSTRRALSLIQTYQGFQNPLPKNFSKILACHEINMAINYYAVGEMSQSRHLLVKALKNNKCAWVDLRFWAVFFRSLLGKNMSFKMRSLKNRLKRVKP